MVTLPQYAGKVGHPPGALGGLSPIGYPAPQYRCGRSRLNDEGSHG